jgi:predicted HNH restriction endonuclease
LKKGYLIDPVADMRPVCPNCHAVIHLCDPPLSIEETKAMIKARPSCLPKVG